MTMIIAATLLGILMHAFAEECELMPPAGNFDSEKYSKIRHVYVTHSMKGLKQQVCREYKTTEKQDGTPYTVVTSDYKIGQTQHMTVVACTNTPKSGSEGQFSVECHVLTGIGGKKIQLESSVIATDNENFALLHTCSKTVSGYITDDIFVLQTNKDAVDQGVKDYIDTKDWSLDSWVSRKNVDCNNIQIENNLDKEKYQENLLF